MWDGAQRKIWIFCSILLKYERKSKLTVRSAEKVKERKYEITEIAYIK